MAERFEVSPADIADYAWQPLLDAVYGVGSGGDPFTPLDRNKDGYVSRKELDRALADPSVKGAQAATASTLQTFRPLIKQFIDDGKDGYKGISIRDMAVIPKLVRMSELSHLSDRSVFRTLDKDDDGKLSRAELTSFHKDRKNGATKDAVAQMLSDFEIIGGADQAISPTEIKDYVSARVSPDERLVTLQMGFGMHKTISKIANTDRRAPSETFLPKGTAVVQGAAGDCWLMSALSSLAHQDPAKVASMMKQNADGTLTVEFPFKVDGKPVTEIVPSLTDGDIARFASAGKSGIWLSAAEKAAGQFFKKHPELRLPLTGVEPPKTNHLLPQDHLYGTRTAFGVQLLTGEPAAIVPLDKLTDAQLKRTFKAAAGSPITAIAGSDWPRQDVEINEKSARSARPAEYGRTSEAAPRPPRRDPIEPEPPTEHEKESDQTPPLERDKPAEQSTPSDLEKQSDQATPGAKNRSSLLPEQAWPEDSEEDDPYEEIGMPAPAHHDFGVLGFDPVTERITVLNPWGEGELVDKDGLPLDGSNDGIMHLTIDQFRRHFQYVTTVASKVDITDK